MAESGSPFHRRVLVWVALTLALGLAVLFGGRDIAPESVGFSGLTMGTSYSVQVGAALTPEDREEVRALIGDRLDSINVWMSTYDPDSQLSRFNADLRTGPVAVGAELFDVLRLAEEVSRRSSGAFDVTVAPLVDAWGFGPAGQTVDRPDSASLVTIMEQVGYDGISLDIEAGTVTRSRPDLMVDLSAIAKGYAAGYVARGLGELGYRNFVVEIGGDLVARGERGDGGAWRVGIEWPEVGARRLYAAVDLHDEAIATSGDYRNFFDDDGVRYAHVIDPRSGHPVPYRGMAVSVIHPDPALADAWATALTVLGPEGGYDLALQEGLSALFLVRPNADGGSPGDSLAVVATPAFDARLASSSQGVR